MHGYIGRANIDHYVSILRSQGLTDCNRDTIIKLLIAEEDRLSRDVERLEFAENRTAKSRDRVTYLTKLRDDFADGSTDRTQAEDAGRSRLLEVSDRLG
jgi:hypothetical protein